MNKKIAVLAGDGIGPEIVPAAVAVLEAVGKRGGHAFEFVHAAVGGQAIDDTGWPLPDDTLQLAKTSDAVLLGAVGGPKWEGLDYERRPERALLGLREQLGLFANLRPAKLYSELADASTLKREIIEGIDVLVVRELTGGIYFGKPKGVEATPTGHRGFNTEVYTTEEITRIAKSPSTWHANAEGASLPWIRQTCWNPRNCGGRSASRSTRIIRTWNCDTCTWTIARCS